MPRPSLPPLGRRLAVAGAGRPTPPPECLATLALHVRGEVVPGELYLVAVPLDTDDDARASLARAFIALARHEEALVRRAPIGGDRYARVNIDDEERLALETAVRGTRPRAFSTARSAEDDARAAFVEGDEDGDL